VCVCVLVSAARVAGGAKGVLEAVQLVSAKMRHTMEMSREMHKQHGCQRVR